MRKSKIEPAVPLAPLVKIEMMVRSYRCFELGLLSLLPLLGVPIAMMALSERPRVGRMAAGHWNPAQRYVFWGTECAAIGLLLLVEEVVFAAAVYLS